MRGLTRAELAEYADLSEKYVGQLERGDANFTIDKLERLAAAVAWNPLDALEGNHEPLSEGVRMLLLDEVQQMLDRLRNMTRWLQALNPALQAPSSKSRAEIAAPVSSRASRSRGTPSRSKGEQP